MSKLRAVGGAIERALVGTEKLSPEAKAYVDKYVHSTGRIKNLPSRKSKLLNFAIGPQGAADVIKARYRQGGVLGPGGVLLGELAPSQEYVDLLKGITSGSKELIDPATGRLISRRKAIGKALLRSPMEALNPAFLLGFPAYDTYSAMTAKPGDENYGKAGIGRALGSGLGFMVGGPLGLVGGLGVSHLASEVGSRVGAAIDGESKPLAQSLPRGEDVARATLTALLDKMRQDAYTYPG